MYIPSKFHIISDLDLDIFDHAREQHIIDQDVEYIVLPGNISGSTKRTMLFAESIAAKYPNSKVVFNYGYLELLQKEYYKIKDSFLTRIKVFKKSPPNLFFPKGEIVGKFDIFCTEGFAYLDEEQFKNSIYAKNFIIKFDEELYIGHRLVAKNSPRYFSYEYYSKLQQDENTSMLNWLNQDNGKPKILITGLDDFLIPNSYNVIWISTGKEFKDQTINSLRHIIKPGLNRSVYFDI